LRYVYVITLFVVASVASADTLFVAPLAQPGGTGVSWAMAMDLREALTRATAGDELWLKQGTYRTAISTATVEAARNASLTLMPGVRLYGGFAGTEELREHRDWLRQPSVISGDVYDDDGDALAVNDQRRNENTAHIFDLRALVHDTMTIFDGVTFVGGNAREGSDLAGGGAIVATGGCPRFNNCTFRSNAGLLGGAIHMAAYSRPRFEYCRFVYNRALEGGAVYLGATDSSGLGATFGQCVFEENEGALVGGAIAFAAPNATKTQIASCVFWKNMATMHGGAVWVAQDVAPYLANSTFVDNVTTVSGGGAAFYADSAEILNSIFWSTLEVGEEEEVERQIVDSHKGEGTPDISTTACLVTRDFDYGFWQSNPFFENDQVPSGPDRIWWTDDDGFRLGRGSVARDAGVIDRYVNHRRMDILGNPRLVDRKVDLGAYESQREGFDNYRELINEMRQGKLVFMLRHMVTDWGQRDRGPSPECFPGRNLIYEGRVQSAEVGKGMRAIGVPMGDVLTSPVCRCWESAQLIAGRHDRTQHWGSGGASNANRIKDLSSIPTGNGNRIIITHDAVILPLTEFTSAEIMEGDAVIIRPKGNDEYEVISHWASEIWERWWIRFHVEATSVSQVQTTSSILAVSPNPSSSTATIALAGGTGFMLVDIVDMLGRSVWRGSILDATTIDVSGWSRGSYIVQAGASAALFVVQ